MRKWPCLVTWCVREKQVCCNVYLYDFSVNHCGKDDWNIKPNDFRKQVSFFSFFSKNDKLFSYCIYKCQIIVHVITFTATFLDPKITQKYGCASSSSCCSKTMKEIVYFLQITPFFLYYKRFKKKFTLKQLLDTKHAPRNVL